MMNIESMRAMVKKMGPDPQGMARLREFARQNHDNAIAMSLVSSRLTDIQRAKQMDEAKKVPAEPNTVIDQVAQSIPMEESGIAGLPVNNITMAANGGIVGYAGDGPQGQLVDEITLPPRKANESFADYRQRAIEFQDAQMNAIAETKRAKAETERAAELAKRGGPRTSPFLSPPQDVVSAPPKIKNIDASNGEKSKTLLRVNESSSSIAKDIDPALREYLIKDAIANGLDPKDVKFNLATPGGKTATFQDFPSSFTPAQTNNQAPEVSQAPPARQLSATDYLNEFNKIRRTIGLPDNDEATKALTEANLALENVAKEKKADVEKYYAGRGDSFKGKDERLAAREAALEKTKSSIEGMAWIQAGLETMATSGSLGQAIAAGGKKGMESYGSGIKNYTDSKEKLDEARDKLDDLRTGYKDMSEKEIIAATREINTVVAQNKQRVAENLYRLAAAGDKRAADLINILKEESKTQAEIIGRETVAEIAARTARLTAEGRLDTAEGKTQFSITKAKLDSLVKEANDLSDSTGGMSKEGQARLQSLRKDIDTLRNSMAVPGAESTMPPAAGTRIKFDAKGNPI